FHQLPEFDHGKRSCRRKLAGHNERRRKPPAAPLLSRKGQILSFLHGDNSKASCSALDLGFSKFLGESIKGVRPEISCGICGNSRAAIDHQWQEDFSSTQVSMPPWSPGRALFSSLGEVLQGEEYFTGVSESSCALSLLSSQTWGATFPARTQAASCFNRPQTPQTTILNSYMNANSWSVKDHYGSESGGSGSSSSRSYPVRNVMELDRSQFARELEQSGFHAGTHNMELDHGRRHGNLHGGIHWSI
ncbi:squamosa promoter-binding-like protein 17, partial [Phalaenopsis equestris]|uniref:squamosa promoter-binding-like protein 17 n=1 Tax=Phalaenopsis equestris TaxID=78828 RepID=UPI0009E3FDE4